jgi:hypothetical protein
MSDGGVRGEAAAEKEPRPRKRPGRNRLLQLLDRKEQIKWNIYVQYIASANPYRVGERHASAILHNDDFRSDSARLTVVGSCIYSQLGIYLWSEGVSIAKLSAPLSAKVIRFRYFHIPCNSIERIRRRSNEGDGPAHCGLVSQLNAGHYGGRREGCGMFWSGSGLTVLSKAESCQQNRCA